MRPHLLQLAESIRAKRHLEIQNNIYHFQDKEKLKGSFLLYFDTLTEKRKASLGNYGNWDSVGKHLRNTVQEIFHLIDSIVNGYKALNKANPKESF